jgi:uridine kinase
MKITYENEEIEVQDGIAIKDGLKEQMEKSGIKDIIAAIYNNQIASLNHPIHKNGKITFINRTNKDGRYIYIRGLLYVMSKAFAEVYPEALLTVNYQLSNSMYGTVDNMEVTDEVIQNVRNKMFEIVEKDLPITKVVMTQEEADEFYKKEETFRGKLQTLVDKDKVSLYYCENYYNYFYGTMPISTGFAKVFDFVKYKNGFLVKYPSLTEPDTLSPNVSQSLKMVSAMEEYDEINKILRINTVHRLNRKIREPKGPKELVLISEALHEKKIAEIAKKIQEHGNVRMVLIAGPSSSGKTTFAGKLGMSLKVNGIKPVTISVDNYFVERKDNPKDENGNYDFECIEALDLDLFNRQLVDLLAGKEVSLPTFNFNIGEKEYKGNTLKLQDDEILVIEGIHCMNDRLTSLIPKENKFKVYISDLTVLNIDYYNRISTTDTRLIRRIVRDHQFRGYSALDTLQRWNSVNKGEQKNIFPFQEDADCMFNSSIVYELAVLKQYAMPLLEEIPDTYEE